jgi:hypothetical protein
MPLNLNAAVNSVTRRVNPNFPASLLVSTGFSMVNHVPVPSYAAPLPIIAQVQPLTTGDVRQLDALNIQGAERVIFMNGAAHAILRVKQTGGDLVVFAANTLPEGNTWKILASLEQWGANTWCKVAVVLTDDLP